VFVLLLALAGFRSVLVSEQFGLDRLNARLENAQEQSQVLRMEVARLENPDRILAVAQGRLGMVPPPARVYLAAVVPGDLLHPVPAPSYNPFSRTSR
jgi:cell division protein FtsB